MSTLQSKAAAAAESVRSLDRVLATARAEWNDSTRQAFDQRHVDAIVTSGRTTAAELQELADELSAALASLRQ